MLGTEENKLPVLPLRDVVVFPNMIVTLFVGRKQSIAALNRVMEENKKILLLTQKESEKDDLIPKDLFRVGTVGTVLQLLKLPDNTVKVLVEGEYKVRALEIDIKDDYFEAHVEDLKSPQEPENIINALIRMVSKKFEEFVKRGKKVPNEILVSVGQIDDAERLTDTIAQHLNLKIADRQALLEQTSVQERLEHIYALMEAEIDVLRVEKKIRNRVKEQMEKSQREYYLNEQMKAIQNELDDDDEGENEVTRLAQKIKDKGLTKEARKKAEGELKKLKGMSPMAAEATVVRNYLDWIVELPWAEQTELKKDLASAQAILDEGHFGLEKVKDRILEYLAVQTRVNKVKGSILCLVGPPGVGKTSLGRSIAKATNRNFVRMSLGGMRDESEIRGHRRTYIGSMPGKIIQGMRKASVNNPLFLLDEIDKLGADWRGDPSSALLEVLDPEQNNTFNDHYIEVDYDLSNVMFITTANSLNLPRPLLDRMEVISIPGYTEMEKIEIAKRYLIPKQIEQNGLKADEWSIDDGAVRSLIRYYSREAGVRNLEREISKLTRKAVKELMLNTKLTSIRVTNENLENYAGVKKYHFGLAEEKDLVGVVTGLAWTEVGGDLLSIEAITLPGKGRVTKTGKLGDVMKESIQAAESYVKSRAASFGINPDIFGKTDIHLHVPEGATPKDGPSAGVAMITAMVSLLTGIAVRRDVAMTGEITLRGRVLPIGGLKEKLLAAARGGIKRVLIPADNEKDLVEIPDNIKKSLEIIPVSDIDSVLSNGLVEEVHPLGWTVEGANSDSLSGRTH